MQIRVALLPHLLPRDWCDEDTIAIVIDTLRFTTTACQAIAAGATALHLAAEIDEAEAISAACTGPKLLCGERSCRRIDGFDLGNSPHEYTSDRVQGAALIFTTTNGTRAVAAVRQAKNIMLAALVNRRAVCSAMETQNAKQVWLVCAGTDDEVALEDVLTAGAILECASDSITGDAAWLAAAAWKEVNSSVNNDRPLKRALVRQLAVAKGGRNLVDAGYSTDLDFAANLDSLAVVPENGRNRNLFEAK